MGREVFERQRDDVQCCDFVNPWRCHMPSRGTRYRIRTSWGVVALRLCRACRGADDLRATDGETVAPHAAISAAVEAWPSAVPRLKQAQLNPCVHVASESVGVQH